MSSRGFTLLEVLVVVVLMALMASLAAPLVVRSVQGVEAQGAARQVAAALRALRSRAIIENRDLAMTVDVDARTFRADSARPEKLSDNVRVRLYTARSEQLDGSAAGIRFFPDGSSTGGEVVLEDARTAYHVQVEWLTGQVAILTDAAH